MTERLTEAACAGHQSSPRRPQAVEATEARELAAARQPAELIVDAVARTLVCHTRIQFGLRRDLAVTFSHKRRAEESPVKAKNQRVGEDRNEWTHDPDLAQRRTNTVPSAQDRGKRET